LNFDVRGRGLKLRIGLEELSKVYLHEETIPTLLDTLARLVKSDGVVKHPVIVDSNTLVVLDGMHRVAALEKLGCHYLPVCFINYKNPGVKVGCWYRAVHGGMSFGELLGLLEPLGLSVNEASPKLAQKALDRRKAVAVILFEKKCYLFGKAGGIREAYTWIRHIEKILVENGLEVSYETERDAERKIRSGEAVAVIMTPRARKEEVLEAALSGRVFAHKTTRHVVPARPMCIDVPLAWLSGDRSFAEVNTMLDKHLSKRRLKHPPFGSLFEGRRYEEELLVFE